MANVNVDLKNASGKYAFKKFRGVDQTVISSDELFAQECVNFRVMSDGTLKKRCGFERIGNLPGEIRAVWNGYVGNDKYYFALAGDRIYELNTADCTHSEVGSVDTVSGRAEFFFYQGALYLLDGESVYVYNENQFIKTNGYIPLYGKGWSSLGSGAQNEPLNCLSPYARISFTMSSDSDLMYKFPWNVESIYKLYINGVEHEPSIMKINSNRISATLASEKAKKGAELIVYLKIADFETTFPSDLRSCKNSVVYGLADNTRLFLYNSKKSKRIYYSRRVSSSQLDELKAQEPTASALYFLKDDYFDVGERDDGITSMCTYDDKLFIFTGSETWYTLCDTVTQLPAAQISNEIGCVGSGATSTVPGGVVTVMPTGVYRLTVSGSAKNVFSYKKISDPISDSVDLSFLNPANIHYCGSRGEIWLSEGGGYSDKVWIYDSRGNWFCFDGMENKGLCEIDGDVGFWNESQKLSLLHNNV